MRVGLGDEIVRLIHEKKSVILRWMLSSERTGRKGGGEMSSSSPTRNKAEAKE